MDAAEDDVGAALARLASDFVPSQGVERMNADADNIAGRDGVEVDRVQRLVDDTGIAVLAPASPRRERKASAE